MEKTGLKPIDDLVKAAVAGDGLAFTALWDTYIDQLRIYVRSRIKSLDDLYVDDICSRSFEKAFRQIGTFDSSRSQFFTWLSTIARNTMLDIIAAERRIHPRSQVVYLDDPDDSANSAIELILDRTDSPLDSIISTENREAGSKYIERLPELYREAARKRLVEGMQYKEIAEAMGLELNTVRTRIRRAKGLIDEMRRNDETV